MSAKVRITVPIDIMAWVLAPVAAAVAWRAVRALHGHREHVRYLNRRSEKLYRWQDRRQQKRAARGRAESKANTEGEP